MPGSPVELREIADDDRLTGLSLGDRDLQPLKTFLQRKAKCFHANDLAKTYGVFLDERVLGYVTLICADVSTADAGDIDDEGVDFPHKDYPAVKIARLAVDRRHRKRGIGEQLVQFSLGLIKGSICPNVGCRFAVVDAKRQSVDFYRRMGFTMLDTEENRKRDKPVMFIDLAKIAL